ncbi:MAG: hypothetical protein JWP17_2652 [Solirubrobacterales bacterium]|jgi:hypothetical protein|nr:hypothetical protein [Solirubrobacterales bacterium]
MQRESDVHIVPRELLDFRDAIRQRVVIARAMR